MKTRSGFSNKKSKGDLYRTPNVLTRMLLPHITHKNKVIIDPCAGYGDIINEVEGNCKDVVGYDIQPRAEGITKGDFMDMGEDGFIITNPPYSLSNQFIDKFKYRDMALLLPTVYLNTSSRFEYWRGLRVLITFNRKLNLTTWHGGEVVDAGAVSYSWFIFDRVYWRNEDITEVEFFTKVVDINPYIKRVGKK